jgi:hypothetical protein
MADVHKDRPWLCQTTEFIKTSMRFTSNHVPKLKSMTKAKATPGLWKKTPKAGAAFDGGGARNDVSSVWFFECMQLLSSRMGRKRGGECSAADACV